MNYENQQNKMTDFEQLENLGGKLDASIKSTDKDGIRFYNDWSGRKYYTNGAVWTRKSEINILPQPRHWT